MNIIAIFGAAFLLNLYLVILIIQDLDAKQKNSTCHSWEEDRYFHLMMKGLGMTWYEAAEEYYKIENFHHLLRINENIEKSLQKQHNLWQQTSSKLVKVED